ncbi:unnamed protein product [Rhodiola kirilowii]
MSQLQQLSPQSQLGALYCEEGDDDVSNDSLFDAFNLVAADLFWEDDELVGLLGKQEANPLSAEMKKEPTFAETRRRAVDWIRKVHSHYAFSTPTAVLAVNYFDRFVSRLWSQMSSPWMSQLAAVAGLSLAAKMEETHVPFLLDFQVGESEYVFEAKTIQRMEMLVLSTLQWKMSPVTPISFFDHVAKRIEFANLSQGEFLWRCECVLLCVLFDDRYVKYLPSVIAGSVMLHVVMSVEPCNAAEYQFKICDILRIDKMEMDSCSSLVMNVASRCFKTRTNQRRSGVTPCSPRGIMDVSFSSDRSNDSWAVAGVPSVTADPEPLSKKCKTAAE